jgi:hypothetical protein
MDNQLFSDISNLTSTPSQGEAEIVCDGGKEQTDSYIRPGVSEEEIFDRIEDRRRTSSEYLTKTQAKKILDNEATVDDINNVFEDITSTLQKLLVDISVLERSRLTRDIDANWNDLDNISSSAINICDRSFGEPTLSSSNSSYRLGTQFGRIFTALTGEATLNPRAASFYAGLSNQYTKNNNSSDLPRDRSELVNVDSKNIFLSLEGPLNYSHHLSNKTKQLVEDYGYKMEMEMNLIFLASIHNVNKLFVEASDGNGSHIELPERDAKEIHEDVIDLLENRVGRWFGMCVDLRQRLIKEWNEIHDASASGVPAKDALSELWDITIGGDKTSVESYQIAKSYKKQSYSKQVSQVFNSLSYESKNKYSQVNKQLEYDTAIVAYDQGWKLTPYGYVLCFYQLHGNDMLMGRIALDEIKVVREQILSNEFDKEIIRQGLEQFYDTDVPRHF